MRFPARLLAALLAALVGLALAVGVPDAGASPSPGRSADSGGDPGAEDIDGTAARRGRPRPCSTGPRRCSPGRGGHAARGPARPATPRRPRAPVDASMALRDLFLARASLRGDDADRAGDAARPALPTATTTRSATSYGVPSTRTLRPPRVRALRAAHRGRPAEPPLGAHQRARDGAGLAPPRRTPRLPGPARRRPPRWRRPVRRLPQGAREPGPLRVLRARAPGRGPAPPGVELLRARRRLRPRRSSAAAPLPDPAGHRRARVLPRRSSSPTTSRRTSGSSSRRPPGWRSGTPTTSTTTAPTCPTARSAPADVARLLQPQRVRALRQLAVLGVRDPALRRRHGPPRLPPGRHRRRAARTSTRSPACDGC